MATRRLRGAGAAGWTPRPVRAVAGPL